MGWMSRVGEREFELGTGDPNRCSSGQRFRGPRGLLRRALDLTLILRRTMVPLQEPSTEKETIALEAILEIEKAEDSESAAEAEESEEPQEQEIRLEEEGALLPKEG